jgi:PHD/YefM family antitoxin component YafN of YafNO toxin-antitoxin module
MKKAVVFSKEEYERMMEIVKYLQTLTNYEHVIIAQNELAAILNGDWEEKK